MLLPRPYDVIGCAVETYRGVLACITFEHHIGRALMPHRRSAAGVTTAHPARSMPGAVQTGPPDEQHPPRARCVV